jgi:hypothetical protein
MRAAHAAVERAIVDAALIQRSVAGGLADTHLSPAALLYGWGGLIE